MTTGNEIVDKVGEIAITGNIIPQMWYETLKKDDGKPYFQAIVILADIVYWYKPVEVRDEKTGRVVGYKKKFSADLLQRTYDSIAEQFGISKNETVNAVKFLEKKGVIYRELRTVQCGDIRCGNVLFLGLNPEKLQEVTFKNHIPIYPPWVEGGYQPIERYLLAMGRHIQRIQQRLLLRFLVILVI